METKPNVQIGGTAFGEIQVQFIVELGRTVETLKTVHSLEKGTIVQLDKLAGEPVDIFANNVKIATGEVVVIDENFGVRIVDVLAAQCGQQSMASN